MVIVTAGVLCGRSLGRRIDVKITDILVFQVHVPSSPEEAGVSGAGGRTSQKLERTHGAPGTLEQHWPIELSGMMEMFSSTLI